MRPGAASFGLMFSIGAFGRAVLLSVIPLQVYTLLGSARDATVLFMVVAAVNLGLSFAVPAMLHRFKRYRVYISCGLITSMAGAFLATGTLAGLPFGVLCREFGGTALFMMQNLYMMDHIKKRDFIRAEPIRLFYSALAWGTGPYVGVLLFVRVDPLAAYALAACATLTELMYFRAMGIKDLVRVAPRVTLPTNPLAFIPRFFKQPRLRLAYAIAVSKSTWWSVLNVYGPIYMVQTGAGKEAGGLVVGACNLLLLLSPGYGLVAHRLGVRRVLGGAFLIAAVATLLVAFSYPNAWLGFSLFCIGGLAVVGLDALGSIPFLRAVHSRERDAMTTVFVTYGQAAQLGPMMVFSVLLTYMELPVVFVFTAMLMACAAWLCRWIPRGM
jgi:MFS family permease